MFDNIPAELRALPQWVCWRYETLDNGKQTKIPYSARNGGKASVTDPTTWADFTTALMQSTHFNGIGFVLSENDPYTIIDLDNKPDKACTLEQLQRHQKIFEAFDSYTEKSVSGTGVHIIVKGRIPAGVHRDNVEVYSSERYMVCTGDVIKNSPIKDYQELLDVLYGEMKPPEVVSLTELEALLDDRDVVEMAMHAANGDKFNQLCAGDMSEYPSQSEADFALLSIIAYYTQSNEQVRRIFRMTALGKRDKAIKNDRYLDFALGKIRAQQPPPVDTATMQANVQAMLANAKPTQESPTPAINVPAPENNVPAKPTQESPAKLETLALPPGLVGDMAQYFYQTAIRPVPEIALAAAIALMAGTCGRAYNVSNTGLNQYIILLARTGSGKEGAQMGIDNLISAVRPKIPMADQFIGPAAFASGQALIKVLNERPCFVSVLGEFGLTLQQLSDQKANSAQIMLRRVLLDLYAKSGWSRTLQSSVYSDTEKNTKTVRAPAVTILGESTPETFFEGLSVTHISEGLIPRFCFIEYQGDRPPRNKNANIPPPAQLAQRFADLITVALTTSNNNTCIPVALDDHSHDLLDAFDAKADKMMNAARAEVDIQLWNRAHLKALKLAALLAVGVNPHKPVVTEPVARWAIDFVERDVSLVSARFRAGDIGSGDSKQFADLRKVVEAYFKSEVKIDNTRLHKAGIIPYAFIFSRVANYASYRNDRLGAKGALKQNLQAMIDSGMLIEVNKIETQKNHGYSGVAYAISSSWV